jgi:hypothetical protein
MKAYRGWNEGCTEKIGRWYTSDQGHAAQFGEVIEVELTDTIDMLTEDEVADLPSEYDLLEDALAKIADARGAYILGLPGIEAGDHLSFWVERPWYSVREA